MSFHKNFFTTFLVFVLLFLCWCKIPDLIVFQYSYLTFCKRSLVDLSTSVEVGSIAIYFLCIVFLVTSFVLIYRARYMEHYNNPKFIFLLFSFFVSIIILSVRSSYLVLMLGWDGLGFTSICLIIFYPNKNTLYNSFLTIFFNRLGDVVMIFSLCFSMINFSIFYSHSFTPAVLILLTLCAFTKRAQFPLSSWLPAAMSAPTPISAIVHSSTLVTAGVFLLIKFFYSYSSITILTLILFFSAVSFLTGGLIANIELDLKKIVAFSTMSQISIIFLICCLGWTALCISHMILHALFKTLLFTCGGVLFLWNLRNQFKNYLSSPYNTTLFFFSLFCRIFGMTGLTFSSSFFSKDLVIEEALISDFLIFSRVLLLGSVFTLMYRRSIVSVINFSKPISPSRVIKAYPRLIFILACLIVVFCPKLIFYLFRGEIRLVFNLSVLLIRITLVSSLIFKFKSFFFPLYHLSNTVWSMKVYTFTSLRSPFDKNILGFLTSNRDLNFKNYNSVWLQNKNINSTTIFFFTFYRVLGIFLIGTLL